jgi:phenylacetate-CoA ligase
MSLQALRKLTGLSAAAERAAWDIYEKLPLSLRYRLFFGNDFFRWSALLKESEGWDVNRLNDYVIEQTRGVLTHAMKHIPYYRNRFSEVGFRPERIQSIEDLKALPYLTKEDVREDPLQIVDERLPIRSLKKRQTGGSSGIPLNLYHSKESRAIFDAFRTSLLGRIGHTPRSREVMLWHTITLGNKAANFTQYGNRLVISMQYLTEGMFAKYVDMIRNFQPEYIMGYPSWLTVFSFHMKRLKSAPFRTLKAVITYSETLSPVQRDLLEEFFHCRVFSMFGMNELAAIGGECEKSTGIHFHPLYGVVEFADTIEGYREIVATGFTNYAMPFIRYRTGDIVRDHSEWCRHCGRHHKVADTIEGRIHEFLVDRNSSLINIRPLRIADFPNVLQCQFFQDQPGKVLLKIVPAKTFSRDDEVVIRKQLAEIMGAGESAMDIEVALVGEIPRSVAGKAIMIEQKIDVRGLFN